MIRYKDLVESLTEMTSLIGRVMKDGDLHHVWKKPDGEYYEIQNRRTGEKYIHKDTLDKLDKKGYSWVNEETSPFDNALKWLNDREANRAPGSTKSKQDFSTKVDKSKLPPVKNMSGDYQKHDEADIKRLKSSGIRYTND